MQLADTCQKGQVLKAPCPLCMASSRSGLLPLVLWAVCPANGQTEQIRKSEECGSSRAGP